MTPGPTVKNGEHSSGRPTSGKARLHDARHAAATMLLVLKVPTRAVMDVMGWSQASIAARYQHVPIEVLNGIAAQVGSLLWQPSPEGKELREVIGADDVFNPLVVSTRRTC